MREPSQLIDRAYEAAAFPELWPETLERLGREGEALGACIGTFTDHWTGFIASPAIQDGFDDFFRSDRATLSQATVRAAALDRPGFVTERDIFTPAEWKNDPLFTDWVARTGGYHAAATTITAASGEVMVFHLHRRKGAAPFNDNDIDALNLLRPHLARAGLLAARWRLERLRVAAEALAVVGLPALILNPHGLVLAANALIQELGPVIKWLPKDRIAFVDSDADTLLQAALSDLRAAGNAASRSFPVRTRSSDFPAIAHLVPTPGMARDLFEGAIAVLVITPLISAATPSIALIRGLFDLTPSEARAAQGIAEGLTIAEMARKQSVSHETVRTHVKAVLAKTGTRRQSETAALLAGIPSLPFSK